MSPITTLQTRLALAASLLRTAKGTFELFKVRDRVMQVFAEAKNMRALGLKDATPTERRPALRLAGDAMLLQVRVDSRIANETSEADTKHLLSHPSRRACEELVEALRLAPDFVEKLVDEAIANDRRPSRTELGNAVRLVLGRSPRWRTGDDVPTARQTERGRLAEVRMVGEILDIKLAWDKAGLPARRQFLHMVGGNPDTDFGTSRRRARSLPKVKPIGAADSISEA